ncbi:PorV/PorQ family protein [bacterium]|nr:PorV/PorQ family protein [bacterium]
MVKSWFSTERGIIKFIVAMSVTVIALSGAAYPDDYRPWAGEFMRMGVGSRAMGMGNAYTAVEGDVYSAYYNPAGLSTMNNRQMAISFRYLSMDRHFKDIAFGSKIGPDASFAFSWINAGTEDVVGRDLNGNPTGSLSDSRNAFAITFSKNLNQFVSIGINAKMAYWKLDDDDAKAFGFDLGVMVRPFKNFTASFVTRDVNSRFTWNSNRWKETIGSVDGQPLEKEDRFPHYNTFGVAYQLFREKLLLASTLELVEGNPFGLDLGAAYKYNDTFTLRAGLYNYTSSDELDTGALTAGFTVRVTGSISLDYAYSSDPLENDSIHCFSLVMTYGVE